MDAYASRRSGVGGARGRCRWKAATTRPGLEPRRSSTSKRGNEARGWRRGSFVVRTQREMALSFGAALRECVGDECRGRRCFSQAPRHRVGDECRRRLMSILSCAMDSSAAPSAALAAVTERPSAVRAAMVEWGTVPQTPIATTMSGSKVHECGSLAPGTRRAIEAHGFCRSHGSYLACLRLIAARRLASSATVNSMGTTMRRFRPFLLHPADHAGSLGCPVARLAQTWPKTFDMNENCAILVFWLYVKNAQQKGMFFFVIARDRRTTPPAVGPWFRRNFISRCPKLQQNQTGFPNHNPKPTLAWLGGGIARSDPNPHPGPLPLGW